MVTTCSDCAFYRADPNNVQQGICYCNPPVPYPIGGPGGQVGCQAVRPSVRQDDPACSHGKPKVLA